MLICMVKNQVLDREAEDMVQIQEDQEGTDPIQEDQEDMGPTQLDSDKVQQAMVREQI
jgi:hypothetical protein